MKLGSLFSGIGGIELGLERSGFEPAWQVEFNPFCQSILAEHWPSVKRYGDIYEVKGKELEWVNCICGGFPCQPFSVAGKRKGTADERWLWPQFFRIICEVRPEWVVIENVPGLLSIDSGRTFAGILRDLANAGYDAEWRTVSASDLGARHLRKRLFIVGYTEHSGCSPRQKSTSEPSRPSFGERNPLAHSNDRRQSRIVGETIPESRNTRASNPEPCSGSESRSTLLSPLSEEGVAHAISDTTRSAHRSETGEGIRGWENSHISEGSKVRCDSGNSSIEVPYATPIRLQRRRKARMSFLNSQKAERILNNLRERNTSRGGIWSIDPADLPDTTRKGGECGGTRLERLSPQLGERVSGRNHSGEGSNRAAQSDLGGMADGVSSWMDYTPRTEQKVKDRIKRIKCLGNAVVPEVSEFIGMCIMESVSNEK